MKTIPAAIQTGIDNGTLATCVYLLTKDGTTYGFTDHDRALVLSGVTYEPTPGLSRIKMNQRDNAEVSNQEITGAWVVNLDDNDLSTGKFDDALFEIFIVNWDESIDGNLTEKLVKLKGNTGILQWSEDGFRVDVHSAMKALANSFGFTVTASCRHQLYGAASDTTIGNCGINPASFTTNTTVTSVASSKMKFNCVALNGSDVNYYAGGTVTFTSGLNSGETYAIKDSSATGDLTLYLPAAFVISPSDAVTVIAGCDKAFTTCQTKFNNAINFGGFPHITNEVNFK